MKLKTVPPETANKMGRHDEVHEDSGEYAVSEDSEAAIGKLEDQMKQAAQALEFEKAAAIRDQIKSLKERLLFDR